MSIVSIVRDGTGGTPPHNAHGLLSASAARPLHPPSTKGRTVRIVTDTDDENFGPRAASAAGHIGEFGEWSPVVTAVQERRVMTPIERTRTPVEPNSSGGWSGYVGRRRAESGE
jgi:hypothetical protein